MDKPLVSIVIPVYNAGALLGRVLDSILVQTEGRFEILLVDDGSRDNGVTEKVIEDYLRKDDRIRLLKQANQGPAVARQHGVEEAKGQYVYVCDQDDYLHPQLLEYCLFAAAKYQVEFVAFRYANCPGDKVPDVMPLPDFADIPVVESDKDFLLAHSFHTDCWVHFTTRALALKYPFGLDSGLVRPYKQLKLAGRWVVSTAVLYFYNPGSAGSMMHTNFSEDNLRLLTNDLVTICEMYEEDRQTDPSNGIWVWQCKGLVLKSLKQALNRLRREYDGDKKLKRRKWQLMSQMIRKVILEYHIPWRYMSWRHALYYRYLLWKYPESEL